MEKPTKIYAALVWLKKFVAPAALKQELRVLVQNAAAIVHIFFSNIFLVAAAVGFIFLFFFGSFNILKYKNATDSKSDISLDETKTSIAEELRHNFEFESDLDTAIDSAADSAADSVLTATIDSARAPAYTGRIQTRPRIKASLPRARNSEFILIESTDEALEQDLESLNKKRKSAAKKENLSKKKLSKENLIYVAFHQANGKTTATHIPFAKERKNTQENTARKAYNAYKENAKENLKNKNYPAALQAAKKGILHNPKDSELYFIQGKAYFAQKNWGKAKASLQSCLYYKPNTTLAHFYLGQTYYKQKMYINAAEHYKRVVQDMPEMHIARLNLAVNLIKQSQYSEASLHLKIILSKKKKMWKAAYYLAKANIESGKIKQALVLLDEHLVYKPQEPLLHILKGEALYRMKRFPEAARSLHLSLQEEPNSYTAWLLLGKAYLAAGSYQKALPALLKAKNIYPMDPRLYYDLGGIYKKLGKKKKAMENFENSLSLKPNYKDACIALLALYKSFGLTARASSALQKTSAALPKDSKHYAFHIQAGDFYFAEKKYDRAQKSYRRAIECNADKASAYFKSAAIFKKVKKYRNAELVYQEFLQKKPSSSKAHRLLGLLYYTNIKIPKRAEKHLKTYLSLKPKAADSDKIQGILKKL